MVNSNVFSYELHHVYHPDIKRYIWGDLLTTPIMILVTSPTHEGLDLSDGIDPVSFRRCTFLSKYIHGIAAASVKNPGDGRANH